MYVLIIGMCYFQKIEISVIQINDVSSSVDNLTIYNTQ